MQDHTFQKYLFRSTFNDVGIEKWVHNDNPDQVLLIFCNVVTTEELGRMCFYDAQRYEYFVDLCAEGTDNQDQNSIMVHNAVQLLREQEQQHQHYFDRFA